MTQDDLYKYKGVYPERTASSGRASRRDAENRLVELRLTNDALVATYAGVYPEYADSSESAWRGNGNSLRVIKVVGADRTWYLYSSTQVISEFEDAASTNYNPGTTPGQAASDSLSVILYQHADHPFDSSAVLRPCSGQATDSLRAGLTTRLTKDNSGLLSNEQAHYPYGEGWYASGTADPSVPRKFVSYEKDTEASAGQLNYAVFREHAARFGRFHSPDEAAVSVGALSSRNPYIYGGDEPIDTSRVPPIYGFCRHRPNVGLFGIELLDPLFAQNPLDELCRPWSLLRFVYDEEEIRDRCALNILIDDVVLVDCPSGRGRGRARVALGGAPLLSGNISNINVVPRALTSNVDVLPAQPLFGRIKTVWEAEFTVTTSRNGVGAIRWTISYDCSTYPMPRRQLKIIHVSTTTNALTDTIVACRR
jgi:hypothetical protein